MSAKVEFLSAILVLSNDPNRLAIFYRDVLGLPLVMEQHDETDVHYGCELGDVHFAIHRKEETDLDQIPAERFRLAFVVFDMTSLVERLQAAGVKLDYLPRNVGFATMTAFRDPDGNSVELTALTDAWYKHLQRRRESGADVLVRWQEATHRPS